MGRSGSTDAVGSRAVRRGGLALPSLCVFAIGFAGCNPYVDTLPPPACRTTADCPGGLGCDADGRCRTVGVATIAVTFGSSATLERREKTKVRLALMVEPGAPLGAGQEILLRTAETPPPAFPSAETFTFDRVPFGAHAALVILDAPPYVIGTVLDICEEDAYGRTNLRVTTGGSRPLGTIPGEEEGGVFLARPGGGVLCHRNRDR